MPRPTRAQIDELSVSLRELDTIVAGRLGAAGPLARLTGDRAAWMEALTTEQPKRAAGKRASITPKGSGPLARLCADCDLSPVESTVLVAALAAELDQRYPAQYAVLDPTGAARGLTADVAAVLVGGGLAARLEVLEVAAPSGRLAKLGLLALDAAPAGTASTTRAIALDADVVAFLAGRATTSPVLSPEFPATELSTVHGRADLVLAPAVSRRIDHILARIEHHDTVMQDWGFAAWHDGVDAIRALFHGPPGTGKTMTAAVIGAEKGRPVYRVDLSALVSKYIGETQKNLERVFVVRQRRGAILFFDEADAIFGARTAVNDSHDRYANQEVSYLLQRLETHRGVVILATNLPGNIDEAFRRRLDVIVEFSPPAVDERLRLWEATIPDDTPLAEKLAFLPLAERYELSGGEIRNAAIEAAYVAVASTGAVTQAMLEASARVQALRSGRVPPPLGG